MLSIVQIKLWTRGVGSRGRATQYGSIRFSRLVSRHPVHRAPRYRPNSWRRACRTPVTPVCLSAQALMGHFLEDAPPVAAPVGPQPPVGAPAAAVAQQHHHHHHQQQQQSALNRSPPEGRALGAPLPPAARPYSRQNTTISPVEADMPPFSAGYVPMARWDVWDVAGADAWLSAEA